MTAAEIIRRVREIQVRTGRQVADVLAGEYVSVFKGGGIEFEEVRPYVPGDDVRTIDWNVTARTGEPFVKRFVEERQLTLLLMADISASQDFGSASRSKREAAAELCALLAFSAIRNDDKVGLVLFHGDVEQYIPPRKGQKHALRVVREVLAHGELEHAADERERSGGSANAGATGGANVGASSGANAGASRSLGGASSAAGRKNGDRANADRDRDSRAATDPAAPLLTRMRQGALRFLPAGGRRLRRARQATDISRAMRFAMSVTKRKAVCFVVSDFLDDDFERALTTANQKHDVIAVLVTDPREIEVPPVGLVALEDAESGRTRLYDTGSAAFRRKTHELASRRVTDLEKRLRRAGIDFIHIDATGSVVEPIVRFFKMRERRMRR
ncbi:MAG TPA: DUF58 domain-containing protein [Candidatus Binatia bacterium]|nr:DUF58 domain-containing protein [Candidatus Binatia bacterium]